MSTQKCWHKYQKGQSMMEYWPTIPAAIMIIISASLIVNFIRSGFQQTSDVLVRSSVGISYEQCDSPDEGETTIEAVVDTHLIEWVSTIFDGNYTIVTYRVTSSEANALSHWTLGIPKEVADNIIDASESWEWIDQDTSISNGSNVSGIKFDMGYGDSGKDGKISIITERMTNMALFQVKTTTSIGFADGETREITLILSGEYDFSDTQVVTKSGNNDGVMGVITAPTTVIDLGHLETTVSEDCD